MREADVGGLQIKAQFIFDSLLDTDVVTPHGPNTRNHLKPISSQRSINNDISKYISAKSFSNASRKNLPVSTTPLKVKQINKKISEKLKKIQKIEEIQ